MKTCGKCKIEKELIEFPKHSGNKDGYRNYCKICYYQIRKEYYKEYRLKNKEHYKEYYKKNKKILCIKQKEYNLKNKEKIKNYNQIYYLKNIEHKKKLFKEYNLKNKEKRNNYYKEKRKNNSFFKLTSNIRSLISFSIKRNGYSKKSKTFNILCCTPIEFKQHLEKQFTNGMNWENQGEWHLDHIYPISLAKDEEELLRLNHYTNFQPLWAEENFSKSNQIVNKLYLHLTNES